MTPPRFLTPTTQSQSRADPIVQTATTIALPPFLAVTMLLLAGFGTQPFDPDCTAEKVARSTAMKATVDVGGRCTPAEAARDTAERATGGK